MLIFAALMVGVLVIFSPIYHVKMRPRTFIILLSLWFVLMFIAFYAGGK